MKERDLSIDVLRIIACLTIVLLHSSSMHLTVYNENHNWVGWQTACIFTSLGRWAVPVFFMISGAFMLQKEIPLKRLYQKNIKRIIIIILFWNIFYNFPIITSSFSIDTIVTGIFLPTGINYHIWFLYTLVMVYAFSPFLKKIVDGGLAGYFILFWIVCVILFHQLGNFQQGAFRYTSYIAQIHNQFFNTFNVTYTGYFVLGYYLYEVKIIDGKLRKLIYLAGAASFIFIIIGTLYLASQKSPNRFYFHENFNILIATTSASIFVLFRNLSHPIKQYIVQNRNIILLLSECTLGVYVIHVFMLNQITHCLSFLKWSLILHIPIAWLLTSILSFATVFFLRKIPLIRTLL